MTSVLVYLYFVRQPAAHMIDNVQRDRRLAKELVICPRSSVVIRPAALDEIILIDD